jgi:CheY-like chemotaxis protein
MRRGLQLEAVGRLAGGVAHEFNNLLLVISGEAERLLDGLEAGDVLRPSAEAVARAAARAAALTQHLLAFGRQQMLIARPLNVNQVVADLAPALAQDLGAGVEHVTNLARDLPAVRMDRDRLEQVLLSVAANAREAMAGNGRVVISTDVLEPDADMLRERPWLKAGQWVRMRVADDGPGMPPEVLARVFEPFYTTKREEGSGFGLSTVYGIIKQSGGYVWIDSAPGAGACVTILLPPAEAAVKPGAAPTAAPAPRPHVLLVEDQDGIREMLTTMLEKQGFQVTTAANAEQALELAPGVPFDLLLTDVVLPGLPGPELARRLRARAPRLRVLFMSGYTGDAFRDQGDFGDERSFIQKPFASKALVERLRSLLETPPGGGAAPVSPFRGQS